jgi:hypothetical protein
MQRGKHDKHFSFKLFQFPVRPFKNRGGFRLKAERLTSESSPFTISTKPGKTSKDKQLHFAVTNTRGDCWFCENAMYNCYKSQPMQML